MSSPLLGSQIPSTLCSAFVHSTKGTLHHVAPIGVAPPKAVKVSDVQRSFACCGMPTQLPAPKSAVLCCCALLLAVLMQQVNDVPHSWDNSPCALLCRG